MKLYVWDSPYSVTYGASVLYAIAESEEDARAMALDVAVSKYGSDPRDRASLTDLGPPTRVRDLPYAEVYEWEE